MEIQLLKFCVLVFLTFNAIYGIYGKTNRLAAIKLFHLELSFLISKDHTNVICRRNVQSLLSEFKYLDAKKSPWRIKKKKGDGVHDCDL